MAEIDPEKKHYIILSGKKFKEIRLDLKLTQSEMAEMLSFETGSPVDIKSISCWENGERKLPSWAMTKAEILWKEYKSLNAQETRKGSVMRNKKHLLAAMAGRVKQLLGGE